MSLEVPFILLGIALIVYFIFLWIFRKFNITKRKNSRYWAVLPAVLLAPFLYAGIIIIWINSLSTYTRTEFNSTEWAEYWEERYTMTEDLIDSELLIGMTKEEIILLLGSNYFGEDEDELSYDIGHLPGLLNIDPSFITIHFRNGKAYKVVQRES